MDIEGEVTKFKKRELYEVLKSKKKERMQVNINPDSLIGREIRYQTALLHQILNEMRIQTIMLETEKKKRGNPPVPDHGFSNANAE